MTPNSSRLILRNHQRTCSLLNRSTVANQVYINQFTRAFQSSSTPTTATETAPVVTISTTPSSGNRFAKSLGLLSHSKSQYYQSKRNFNRSAIIMSNKVDKVLTLKSINPNVVKMEYAVRGAIPIRAGEIEKELQKGVKKPFTEVIRANIGDCHAVGNPSISFIRSVLACVLDPSNLKESKYPEDVKSRANAILDGCGGRSIGSYSDSAGIEVVRRHVAKYIEQRDGYPSKWEDIYLSAGASPSIKAIMALFNFRENGLESGIMVPIPQYPLYSATIAEYGMHQVGYYLDEDNCWGLSIPELERALAEGKKGCIPRAIVVINPGNPTGQVLTKENIQEIIKFSHKHKLFIFADEVYQDNIYDCNSAFHSFKKVSAEMGEPYSKLEMGSFMSCSKGYMGECGIRGGYCELINLDHDVRLMFQKSISAQLCPTTVGQAAIDCVVNPPCQHEPSYGVFLKQRDSILASLQERAEFVAKSLNSFEGFKCNPVQGAMYAFPQINLPPKLLEEAKKKGIPGDTFYALELLEQTGVCIVPGSGFGQKPGTYHFRTTILPQIDKLKVMMDKFEKFNKSIMAKY